MKDIKIEYDKEAQAVYIQLSNNKAFIKTVVTFDDEVNVDYKVSTDKIVGIEILNVKSMEMKKSGK